MTASSLYDFRAGASSSIRDVIGFTNLSIAASGFRVGAITSEKASFDSASFSALLPTNPVAPSNSSRILGILHPKAFEPTRGEAAEARQP
jgi:hypothetical protein